MSEWLDAALCEAWDWLRRVTYQNYFLRRRSRVKDAINKTQEQLEDWGRQVTWKVMGPEVAEFHHGRTGPLYIKKPGKCKCGREHWVPA